MNNAGFRVMGPGAGHRGAGSPARRNPGSVRASGGHPHMRAQARLTSTSARGRPVAVPLRLLRLRSRSSASPRRCAEPPSRIRVVYLAGRAT
jgi:hypothetical protein